jgi:hypothetical protein
MLCIMPEPCAKNIETNQSLRLGTHLTPLSRKPSIPCPVDWYKWKRWQDIDAGWTTQLRDLTTETVQGAALSLESVDDV